jgi:hypothetical protein
MSKLVIVSGIVILLIVIVYYLLRDSGISLTSMQSGKTATTIEASKIEDAQNFTYSMWFFVSEWSTGEEKPILRRMGESGIPCPNVYLGANENNINVKIGCRDDGGTDNTHTTHTCQISNVPLQKWVNLIVSVYGRSVDLYIDGKLVRTCVMPGVANVSAVQGSDVKITPEGGFTGETSQFVYWPNATNPSEAAAIYRKGYGGSLIGNLLNKYRFQFTFIKDGRDVSSFQI